MPSHRPGAGTPAVLIGLLGLAAGTICGLMAFVLVPEVGLFGDHNRPAERTLGLACALATGPLVVAGLLYLGARRRDATLLVPAVIVAGTVSIGIALLAR